MDILTPFQTEMLKAIGASDLALVYARQKQVGMDDYWLAIACQRVRRIKILPRMIKHITIADLQTYFLEIANSLMKL